MKYFSILLVCAAVLLVQLTLIRYGDLFIVGIILAVFFYKDTEALCFALMGGILRDLYFPLFGFHSVLYVLLTVLGIVVLQAIITHRSFWGFVCIAVMEIGASSVLVLAISFITALFLHGADIPPLSVQTLLTLIAGSTSIFGFSLLGYAYFERIHKTSRYAVDIERI